MPANAECGAAEGIMRLANVCYTGGAASYYLEVLDSETPYFYTEIGPAQRNERLALVQLYRALAVGWQR